MFSSFFAYNVCNKEFENVQQIGGEGINIEQRNEFWCTLCSLKGDNYEQDRQELNSKIIFPRFLYRYRPVNMNNLEALRTNRLYFSSANYFDDPFDTFLHIDIRRIKEEFESNFNDEAALQKLAAAMKEFVAGHEKELPKDFVDSVTDVEKLKALFAGNLTSSFLSYLMEIRNEIRKETWSVCFSENGFNENLWLKYADQHKGYALIYDLANVESLRCGTMEKCKNCGILNYGTPLYPINYSDTPYDATHFAKYVLGQKLSKLVNFPLPEFMQKDLSLGISPWERERTTLLKKFCHHYDEEWRMITACPMNPPIMREWIPSGIILGLNMGKSEENLVIELARSAGIQKIYKSYIDIDNKLNAYLLAFEDDQKV